MLIWPPLLWLPQLPSQPTSFSHSLQLSLKVNLLHVFELTFETFDEMKRFISWKKYQFWCEDRDVLFYSNSAENKKIFDHMWSVLSNQNEIFNQISRMQVSQNNHGSQFLEF